MAIAHHGEVFTRRWVVEAILDLVGYTTDQDLIGGTVIEPSCGSGAFLVPIAERLIAARGSADWADLAGCIRAYDLQQDNVDLACKQTAQVLLLAGCPPDTVDDLVTTWVRTADFLLDDEPVTARWAVGNPPYIRLEDLPKTTLTKYREAWPSMKGRADIYVGFIERMLGMLTPDGRLGVICADRWMRNDYGEKLRKIIPDRHAVEHIWSMHDVDAFEDDVAAYPAVTVIRHGEQGLVSVADCSKTFGQRHARKLVGWALGTKPTINTASYNGFRQPVWPTGGRPWPTGSIARLRTLSHIQQKFPPLEDPGTGTKVSIGIASGDDAVYIVRKAPVEQERLLPLVMAEDLATGEFVWGGKYLVNPWDDDGLVDLRSWPRLKRYYQRHKTALLDRHIVRTGNYQRWYKTIDRVRPGLSERPKLLIPELKTSIHPVLESGGFYPHHNVYYVISDTWDLEVLGGLLLSQVAQAFIEAYCVRMRNDTLRFQAQYLRQIHVPRQSDLTPAVKGSLKRAFRRRDVEAATRAALGAYGLKDLPD